MKKMKKKVFLGPLFKSELTQLEKALKPKHPFLFLLGGAKFETKLTLLDKYQKLLTRYLWVVRWHIASLQIGVTRLGHHLVDSEVELSAKLLKAENMILPVDVVSSRQKQQRHGGSQ
jgi:3-phosphoglycerate kinase